MRQREMSGDIRGNSQGGNMTFMLDDYINALITSSNTLSELEHKHGMTSDTFFVLYQTDDRYDNGSNVWTEWAALIEIRENILKKLRGYMKTIPSGEGVSQ